MASQIINNVNQSYKLTLNQDKTDNSLGNGKRDWWGGLADGVRVMEVLSLDNPDQVNYIV